MNISPDFIAENINNSDQNIDYIHRRTDKEEIYFISNSSLNWQEIVCSFRVNNKKTPFIWKPGAGTIEQCKVYQTGDRSINIPLRMPPVGSVFVVFKDTVVTDNVTVINKKNYWTDSKKYFGF